MLTRRWAEQAGHPCSKHGPCAAESRNLSSQTHAVNEKHSHGDVYGGDSGLRNERMKAYGVTALTCSPRAPVNCSVSEVTLWNGPSTILSAEG